MSETEMTPALALLSELVYEQDNDKTQNSKTLATNGLQKMRQDPKKATHLKSIEIVETSRDYMYAVDHSNKRQYFISRGTNITNVRDILCNDAVILISSHTGRRYKTFCKFIDKNIDKNPGYTNITGGHSLGGTVASFAFLKCPKLHHCETFNAGSSPSNISTLIHKIKNIFTTEDRSTKILSHHIQLDVISYFSLFNSKQIIHPTQASFFDRHSISNFTNKYCTVPPQMQANFFNKFKMNNIIPALLNGVDCILNEFNQNKISGIAINDKTCDFLLQEPNEQTRGIYIKDLAAALSVYYDETIPDNMKYISFSLDPTNVNDLKSKQEKVFYPDKLLNRRVIGGTEFGDILYQADFLMKQLSLGLNKNRQLLNKDEYLAYLGFTPSIYENSNQTEQSEFSRLWLKIKDVNLKEYKEKEISMKKMLLILDITGEVNARQIQIVDNNLTDKVIQDPSKSSYQFAKNFSDQYSKIEEQYPIFKRLRQLFKANVLAQWMYQNQIPIDIDIVKQILNRSNIQNYDFFSPSLYYSLQTKQGNIIYNKSVVGGVNVSTNIQQFINKCPLQTFNKYQTIPNPLFKKNYCQECQEELTNEELIVCKLNNNKFLCKVHSGYQCEFCKEIILPNTSFFQLDSNLKIHPSCFQCDFCGDLISSQYVKINNGLVAHSQCARSLQVKVDEQIAEFEERINENVKSFI